MREFLFSTVGWDKDGNPNVAAGRTVLPLPYRGMAAYPYRPPERFPWTADRLRLVHRYQTRWISGR